MNTEDRNWKDRAVAIVGEAKNLWKTVSDRQARKSTSTGAADVAALASQLAILEEEARASFDVVRAIAQQHSGLSEQHMQLIQAVEEVQARNRILAWTCGALGVLALAGFVLAIMK